MNIVASGSIILFAVGDHLTVSSNSYKNIKKVAISLTNDLNLYFDDLPCRVEIYKEDIKIGHITTTSIKDHMFLTLWIKMEYVK